LDRGPGNPGPVVAIPIQNSGARWIATAPARKQENFVQSTVTRGTLSACGENRYSYGETKIRRTVSNESKL
jgi:hypothetical protein